MFVNIWLLSVPPSRGHRPPSDTFQLTEFTTPAVEYIRLYLFFSSCRFPRQDSMVLYHPFVHLAEFSKPQRKQHAFEHFVAVGVRVEVTLPRIDE